jgi:hypothetical protein
MACKIGWQTTKGKDKSGWQEMAETRSGNDGCGGGRWRRWRTTAAEDDNGDGGQQQRRKMKTADNKGTQDWLADYKGEGGERVANNNGIRQKADKPAGQRA